MEETPFEDRIVPRAEIDWERSCWWWYPLTRAVQPAIRFTTLAFSLASVWLVALGIFLATWLFQPRWNSEQLDWANANFSTLRSPGLRPVIVDWAAIAVSSVTAFEGFGIAELAFSLFVFLWCATIAGLCGGVLARRSAVEIGQRTVATWMETIVFIGQRWHSFFWSVGMHVVGIGLLLIPMLFLGWMTRLGTPGVVVASLGLILALPLVVAVGRMALSATICYPLSICTIAVEKKGDAFEGFSRSNAYLFQRPVVAALCGVLLLLIGVVGEQLVYWTLHIGWGLVTGVLRSTGGQSANELIALGDWCVGSLVAAYWFGYFWSAAAALYLILRKSVDHCELDEMELVESDAERTLPPIPTSSQALAGASDSNPDSSSGSESSEK